MQAAPIGVPEQANPNTGTRLDQLARQLSTIYTIDASSKKKADLLQHMHSWENFLHAAYAVFKNEFIQRHGIFTGWRVDAG